MAMKKFIVLSFTLLITLNIFNLNLFTPKASQEKYMRVLENGVYIYADNNFTTKLFELPYTYYVKVESVNGDIARVSYGSDNENYPVIMGFCKFSELSETTSVPINPYSTIKVSCLYSDVLFNDPSLVKAYFNVPENTFMIYYGSYKTTSGGSICYVYCNNKLGYFDINSLNPFSVPLHPDEIPIETPPPSEEQSPEEENKKPSSLPAESLQIIIILGLSIISISIVYYLFKPQKQRQANGEFFKEDS